MIDAAIDELGPLVGISAACAAVGRPRQSHYRWHRQSPPPPRPERVPKAQPRALSEVERKEVLAVLHSDEHVDEAPATVYAKLLDEGTYLGGLHPSSEARAEAARLLKALRRTRHPKPERVKGDETTSYADWMSASRLGSLIHAPSGSFGGVGGW